EGVIRHDVGEIFKVETDFGFHVVQVTGKKEAVKMIRVARLRIPIEPTQQTYDSVWAQASQFAGSYRTREAFDEAVREQQLEPRERIIQPMENHIPGIGSPREMVRWAFDDKTKPGTVSEKVFEGENTYVVAVLEERSEAGIQPLENVKDEIEPLVGREVRARVLKEEFNKHMGENIRITELAHKLDAELDTLSGISFASPNIPGFGREPKLTGTIMSVEKNRLMGPLQGNMGVYAFAVQKIMPAPETDNFARIIQQKQNQFNSLVGGGQQGQVGQVFEALKEISEIEDNRILYY
ncbi:MAG: hypothetical protein R6U19_05260, partial [Bacteroidales bacterium]